jgi:hypothetical protein
MIECAVVVPSRNTPRDMILLQRFLLSLNLSDFPKQYTLITMVGWETWNIRSTGVETILQLNPEFVLVADNDFIVPRKWWSEFQKIFEDLSVTAVGPVIDGLNYNKMQDPKLELQEDAHNPVGGLLDGFVVFRTSWLRASGVREPGVNSSGHPVVAHKVTALHNKDAPAILEIIDCTHPNYVEGLNFGAGPQQ